MMSGMRLHLPTARAQCRGGDGGQAVSPIRTRHAEVILQQSNNRGRAIGPCGGPRRQLFGPWQATQAPKRPPWARHTDTTESETREPRPLRIGNKHSAKSPAARPQAVECTTHSSSPPSLPLAPAPLRDPLLCRMPACCWAQSSTSACSAKCSATPTATRASPHPRPPSPCSLQPADGSAGTAPRSPLASASWAPATSPPTMSSASCATPASA